MLFGTVKKKSIFYCEIPRWLEGENEVFLIRMWKPLSSTRILKTVRLMTIRKWIISASGGLGLLQMVSVPGIGLRTSEDVEASRRVDCEISHRLKRGMKHSL